MSIVNYDCDEVEDNLVEEYDESGATVAEYSTEPNQFGNVVSQRRNGQDNVYHYDGQGSTLALTNDDGDITDTYFYSAFGELTDGIGATVNPFQWMARKQYYRDKETGQCEIRRRCLFSAGRWLTLDPIKWLAFAIRPYIYARNSPLLFSDPSGLAECKKGDCEIRLLDGGNTEICIELIKINGGRPYKFCNDIDELIAEAIKTVGAPAANLLKDEIQEELIEKLLQQLGGRILVNSFWLEVYQQVQAALEAKETIEVTLSGVSLQITVSDYKYERRDCWCGFWYGAEYHWGYWWEKTVSKPLVVVSEKSVGFHAGLSTTNVNDFSGIKSTIQDLLLTAYQNQKKGGTSATLFDHIQNVLASGMKCAISAKKL